MLVCEHCHQQHGDVHRYCPATGRIIAPQRFFPPGTVLDGKYRLGRVIGAGGMGAVLVATHVMLNKEMAAKLMLPELSRDREMVARMVREAQVASATGHRNIALVTDMGWSEQGALYVIMELLHGLTLTQLLERQGTLPVSRAVGLLDQLLAGLAAVHDRGIVHRDVKPDNLMVVDVDGEEVLKILDFGISKVLDDDALVQSLTSTGMVLGTPHFMSPEQARGAAVDHRADIYAAGGILYMVLTGRRPLEAPNYNAMKGQILEGKIAPLCSVGPQVPAELDAIVQRALSRAPADRFQDAETFRQALLPFASESEAKSSDMPEHLEKLSLVSLGDRSTPAKHPPVAASDSIAPASEAGECSLVPMLQPVGVDSKEPPAPARHVQRPRRTTGTLYEPRTRIPTGKLGIVLVVVALISALWFFRAPLLGLLEDRPEVVLILVDTEPSDAEVYVDEVLHPSHSIQLPRSDRTFAVRVSKEGYLSKTVRITADQTRMLRLVLRLPRN